MNKLLISLFSIVAISFGTAFASFSGSFSISTVTCSVAFPVTYPTIVHSPLTRISSVNRIVVTTGTVSDTSGMQSISMCYWTDNNTSISTSTANISASAKSYSFQFSVSAVAGANTFYYYLTALNSEGSSSQTANYTVPISSSMTQSVSSSGGTITLASGDEAHGDTSLVVPEGALSSPENISISELSPNDSSVPQWINNVKPIAVYKFSPEGLRFNKSVTLNLYFSDLSLAGGTKNDLQILWWDGFEWRLVGGTVNSLTNIVTAYISHFSLYGIFHFSSISDNDYRPKEKIITPYNQDGINDYATFGGLALGDTVNIYDVRGRKVRQISNTNVWDGKDDGGSYVESGVYVYQIKSHGKTISGVIAVAK